MAEAKKTAQKPINVGPLREDEIIDLVDAVMEESNPFYISPELIPDGYSVEWKVREVMGKRMPNQGTKDILHAKTRWEPVNITEHPQFRALGSESGDKNTVEKG